MSSIQDPEVKALLEHAEAFARAGDTAAALERARSARRKAECAADVATSELTSALLLVAEIRRREEVLARRDAYVEREVSALDEAP